MINVLTAVVLLSLPLIDAPPPTCGPQIRAAAPSASVPWVQIANPCDTEVDLAKHVLRWSDEFDYSRGAAWLEGQLAPGECVVVHEFDPGLWANEACAIGFALFNPLMDVFTVPPSDSVSYGAENCGDLDWAGKWADVDAPGPQEHIVLTLDGWDITDGVEPPACKQVVLLPPVLTQPYSTENACPALFCDGFTVACVAGGVPEAECVSVAGMCADTPCEACDEAMAVCNKVGGEHCDRLELKCRVELASCCTLTVIPACPSTEAVSNWIGEYCTMHPFGRSEGCGGLGATAKACVIELNDNLFGCDVTTCEYEACAAALAVAPCDVTPVECLGISSCEGRLPDSQNGPDDWRDTPRDCCYDHGIVAGKQDTCAASEGSFCLGCDYEAVLCMTHGCGTPGFQDCCLSDKGETVAC